MQPGTTRDVHVQGQPLDTGLGLPDWASAQVRTVALGSRAVCAPSSEGAPEQSLRLPAAAALEREKPNPAQHTSAQTAFLESSHPFTPPGYPADRSGKRPPRWGLLAEHPSPGAHTESPQPCCKTPFPTGGAGREVDELLCTTFKCM